MTSLSKFFNHFPLFLSGSYGRYSFVKTSSVLLVWVCFFLAGIPSTLWAQNAFLDFSAPAREAALGGNGVALPEGTSSLIFNPAGLGNQSQFEVSARYENLFSGIEGDSLSTGNVSGVFPLERGDALGFSVDHFGANDLQQDRLLAGFGKSFKVGSALENLRLGVSLSYLRQQFTLLAPLAGINPSSVSSGAFSVGAGALYDPVEWGTIGLSAEDLNQPNLGVVGVETLPILLRYGIALKPHVGSDRLMVTLSQEWSGSTIETQGGAEWLFSSWGTALRVGGDANMGAVGLGWRTNGLSIDYAYQFSWNAAPSLGAVGLPGSHLIQISFNWENTSREKRVFDGLLYRGDQDLKAQKWQEAFWYFQQAYLLRPDDQALLARREKALKQYNLQRAAAYFKEGQKAENQGYFREAQRDYEWALALGDGDKTYAEARDRVKKAVTQVALSDPRVQKLLESSVTMIKEGDRKDALVRIKEAQAFYPQDAFLEFMSKAFSQKAYTELAKKDVNMDRMAVEAEIYRSKGRMDLAKETWTQMLKLDPQNAMARENLAESTKPVSNEALSPEDRLRSQALLQKGLKAYVNGDTDQAIRYWEEVLKIDPHNVNALNNLTRVKMDEGGTAK